MLNMEHNVTLKHRIDVIFFQIVELQPNLREDMRRLWRPARALWDELDKEMIKCRRANKLTSRYREIEQDLTNRLDVMDQHLTFATLLTK
jgi:phosphoglycerate-specific signal transduction histidine kinase